MFFPVFWTIYIPIVTIMLAAAGEWLIHALRQLPRATPDPTPMSVMRERVVDGTDLATAMLDVPSQLAKRLDSMNGPPERRRRDRRYERLMLVDNWR